MSNEKPEALELADIFENLAHPTGTRYRAATELRRQHARIQELEAMLDAVGAGGVSAQRVTQGKDHIEQPIEMVAAPVVLPEPDEYQYRMKGNWDDKLPWTPWEACSKESAAIFRKLKEVHNWIYEARERYTEQQVRALLAKDLDAVNLDRLGKALTKPGHATLVSQEEAAADIPRWVNALTSCVLEIPEAAPQPQADALDTERLNWLIEQGCSNGVVYENVFGDFWMVWLDGDDVSKDKHQADRYPTARDAIDAATAAAKESR